MQKTLRFENCATISSVYNAIIAAVIGGFVGAYIAQYLNSRKQKHSLQEIKMTLYWILLNIFEMSDEEIHKIRGLYEL